MKNIKHILVFAFTLFSTLLFGQTNTFELGIVGGGSLASLRGNDVVDEHDFMLGYSSGISFVYHLSERFSLKTNVLYERKGSETEVKYLDEAEGVLGGMTNAYVQFNYLTMPILTQYSIGNKQNFFINAGPYFGYLLKSTQVIEAVNGLPRVEIDQSDYLHKLDVGFTAGLGGKISLKENLFLSLEIRNNLGLYNVSKVPVIFDGELLINSTNMLVGLSYRLVKPSIGE